MAITHSLTFSATPPTIGEAPTTFNTNAIACWNVLKNDIVPTMNTISNELNVLETTCINSASDAAASAQLALATGNFKGIWSNLTSYSVGWSVAYGDYLFVCKTAHSNVTPSVVTNIYWGVINAGLGVTFTPTGGLSSTNVQSAIVELDTEKARIDNLGGYIHSAPAEAIGSTDELGFWDSLSTALRRITFADLLTTITSGLAPLTSPSFTGNPVAPTPAVFDNDFSIATTNFVTRANGQIMICEDRKASGVQGGTAVVGLNIRELGSVPVYNGITGASLDGALKRITLPVGTYRIQATAPHMQTDTGILILRNITASSDAAISDHSFSNNGGTYCSNFSTLDTVITITVQSVFELHHIMSTGRNTYGLGGFIATAMPAGYTTTPFVYARITIERIA